MNRQKFRKAYESVRPDEEAQDRMLNHILLGASEIAPVGKDDTMKQKKMRPMMLVALVALIAAMTVTVFASEVITGWFKQYFEKQNDIILTAEQVQYIEENEQVIEEVQMQNNCTIELKSFMTDGQYMCMILGITAPEGTKIEDAVIGNFGGHPGILTPEAEWTLNASAQNMSVEDDGDGRDNTANIVFEAMFEYNETNKPFDQGTVWRLHIEDLTTTCVNEEYLAQFEVVDGGFTLSAEETAIAYPVLTLAEGTWDYQFTIEDGDFRTMEIVPDEPIVTSTVVGVKPMENGSYEDYWENVTISSVTLRSLSMTVNVLEEFAYTEECYAVMHDGRRIELIPYWGYHYFSKSPIIIEELDHILLADGTKLMAP